MPNKIREILDNNKLIRKKRLKNISKERNNLESQVKSQKEEILSLKKQLEEEKYRKLLLIFKNKKPPVINYYLGNGFDSGYDSADDSPSHSRGTSKSTDELLSIICSNFTPEQLEEWKNYGFSESQIKEWSDLGFSAQDAGLCAWARDIEKIPPIGGRISSSSLGELKKQHRKWLKTQQINHLEKNKELEAENAQLLKEKEVALAKILAKDEEIDKRNKEVYKLVNRIDKKDSDFFALTEKKIDLLVEITRIENDYKQLQSIREGDILTFETYKKSSEIKNKKLRKKLDTEKTEHNKSYLLYLDEEKKATKLKSDLDIERKEHEKTYRDLTAEIADKVGWIDFYKDEIKNQKRISVAKIKNLKSDLNALKEDNKKLVAELKETDSNLEESHDILATKNQTISEYWTQIQDLESEKQVLSQTILDKNNGIADLNNEIDNLNDTLTSERNDSADEIAQKDIEIQTLTDRLTQAGTDLTAMIGERDARPDITLDAYNREKQAATNALTAMEGKRDARANITPGALMALQDQVNTLTNELNVIRTELDAARNTITTAQTQLGIPDLTTLPPLPDGVDLVTLITHYHTPPAPVIHTIYVNNDAPGGGGGDGSSTTAQADWKEQPRAAQSAQRQAEQAKNESTKDATIKEEELVTVLNTFLNLGIKPAKDQEKITFTQTLERIKEIIGNPATVLVDDINHEELKNQLKEAEETITKLQEKSKEITPFGEDLEIIKEIDLNMLKELLPESLHVASVQPIKQAKTYQQIASFRNNMVKKHLAQNLQQLQSVTEEKMSPAKSQDNWKIATAAVSTVSLLGLIALIGKVKQLKRANDNYQQGYKDIKEEMSELRKEMQTLLSQILHK